VPSHSPDQPTDGLTADSPSAGSPSADRPVTAEPPAAESAESAASASTGSIGYEEIDEPTARAASRHYWDEAADDYQLEHGRFLGDVDFCWCPEGLRESELRLLGDVAGRRVLEIGCGAAQCARWLTAQGATVLGLDLSAGQLRHAAALGRRTGVPVALAQADATALPLPDGSVDLACSAYGAVPFVADSGAVMREVARVLRPGGRWVFSTNHPMIWCLPDEPDETGLRVIQSYFDRRAYTERDVAGAPTYVETHRTMGDRIREIVAAGLTVIDVIEPEWPADNDQTWGQWGPVRGWYVPSTSIFVTARAG
jgi:ubiquinone/menaquinone biosynthesis C-methylase UbiE